MNAKPSEKQPPTLRGASDTPAGRLAVLCSIGLHAQVYANRADIIAVLDELKRSQEKHTELLLAVERVHVGESRHETALRYIREREARARAGRPDDTGKVESP